ncbi:RNA polymerase sigma factor [Methylovirgula sp. 4M-Z18]|uniref:RNA polymerase sigma factor n=1 Tax=Methylovirgula sp. 4M-Z18 TaxID=2293567 RepID=UPI0013144DAF|nr:sigma-70 family RNA polymerase sigma factor [Methylovirgula sp. 4M-Z18]
MAIHRVDDWLLGKAIEGDVLALERLLAVVRPDLSRYARRHCQSQDVEDAVQDALWIINQRLGSLRSLSSFAGWAFQIVKRLCLNLNKVSMRLAHAEFDGHHVDATQNPETRMIVISAIASLPPHYREALLLFDFLGHSAGEVSHTLGIGEAAARARLHRARMMVREDFADVGPLAQGIANGIR